MKRAQKLVEEKKIAVAYPDPTSGKITIKIDGSLRVVETLDMLDNYVTETVDDDDYTGNY